VKDPQADLSVLFEFLGRSQILEILDVKHLGEQEGGFVEVVLNLRSPINNIPCFQTLNVKMTRKCIENMYKMLPKKA